MTAAGWRVTRRDAAGQDMAPMDYTDKAAALDCVAAAERIGLDVALQQFDDFDGTWKEVTR